MLIFWEKYCLNKNDIIDGWATIISCQGSALQSLKSSHILIASSGGGATISDPPGPQDNGRHIGGLAVNTQ